MAIYCNILKEMCLVFVYDHPKYVQIQYILFYFTFPGRKFC